MSNTKLLLSNRLFFVTAVRGPKTYDNDCSETPTHVKFMWRYPTVATYNTERDQSSGLPYSANSLPQTITKKKSDCF